MAYPKTLPLRDSWQPKRSTSIRHDQRHDRSNDLSPTAAVRVDSVEQRDWRRGAQTSVVVARPKAKDLSFKRTDPYSEEPTRNNNADPGSSNSQSALPSPEVEPVSSSLSDLQMR